jgi:hypothetical protein
MAKNIFAFIGLWVVVSVTQNLTRKLREAATAD